jgi:hypothetical protein
VLPVQASTSVVLMLMHLEPQARLMGLGVCALGLVVGRLLRRGGPLEERIDGPPEADELAREGNR